MTDCPRAEIRDLLPDYAHGNLDAELRDEVKRHLDQCAECAAELALLQSARAALSRAPAVDVARISGAVNAIRRGGGRADPAGGAPSRWRAMPMRIAATIALVVLGGGALYLGTRHAPATSASPSGSVASEPSVVPRLDPMVVGARRPIDSRSAMASAPATRAPAAGITFGGGVSDLTDSDIERLIGELGKVNGVLATEPEPWLSAGGLGRGSR